MNTQLNDPLNSNDVVRSAGPQDVSFLAQIDLEATRAPFQQSFWDDILEPTGTSPLQFLESMLQCGASHWGQIQDFLVIERNGQPVAACAVFRPADISAAHSPLNIDKLPQIAEKLGWTPSITEDFRQAYLKIWEGDHSFLKPQADMIVETVAVLPEHRGLGLGHRLMQAAFKRAREAGASSLGVMVIRGNEPAQALYEKYFERFATFYPAFFNHTFSGVTKYRATLNASKENTSHGKGSH